MERLRMVDWWTGYVRLSTPAGRNAQTPVIRRRLGEPAKSTLSCLLRSAL